VAGPEELSLAAFVGKALAASGDTRTVVADLQARYFGAALDDVGLKPRNPNPRIGPTRGRAHSRPVSHRVGAASRRAPRPDTPKAIQHLALPAPV